MSKFEFKVTKIEQGGKDMDTLYFNSCGWKINSVCTNWRYISISSIWTWVYRNMLVADNEFGAPWNDQFYTVRYVDFDGNIEEETLVLPGPKKYDEDDLYRKAKEEFNGLILNIWNS